MRSAKTAGGITMFASSKETVSKWVMNRPYVSKFYEALDEICGITKSSVNSRKCLRQSEIQKSNRMVEAVVDTLDTLFLNRFNEDLDSDNLYNIVSGAPTSDAVSEILINMQEIGE